MSVEVKRKDSLKNGNSRARDRGAREGLPAEGGLPQGAPLERDGHRR